MVRGKLHTPQEVEVHYILPALRSALTKELKAQGKSQKEIAQLLNVTEPAVSQYGSAKRAKHVEVSPSVKAEVAKVAMGVQNKDDVMCKTQALLKVVRTEGITCSMCKSVAGAPPNCTICLG